MAMHSSVTLQESGSKTLHLIGMEFCQRPEALQVIGVTVASLSPKQLDGVQFLDDLLHKSLLKRYFALLHPRVRDGIPRLL